MAGICKRLLLSAGLVALAALRLAAAYIDPGSPGPFAVASRSEQVPRAGGGTVTAFAY
ncbi:MAG: hypothetical protein KBD01_09010 [Acidobacteria bacterium]|nr:hypothetical protein [Acidobacteriota bacterium]